MKFTGCTVVLCLVTSAIFAQAAFKEGYALRGNDTIRCKIKFDSKHDHAQKTVTLLVEGEEVNFVAGGSITGYGLEDNGVHYDFGTVDVEMVLGPQRRSNLVFVRKIVAGIIDLYEYEYSITTSKTVTKNDVPQPSLSSSSTQSHTDYYIAKADSTKPLLATPVLLPGYRKKDLEKYLGDNAELFAKEDKKYSHKELIATLKEYNNSYVQKKP